MKKSIMALAIFALSTSTFARGEVIARKGKAKVIRNTPDRTSCFPKKLNNMLLQISKHFGRPVSILSGYRSPEDNRRRGGAKSSQHIHCKAADFKVPGANRIAVGKYLRRMKNRGGAGFYCSGRFHIDTARRRSWGGCKSQYVSYNGEEDILDRRDTLSTYNGEIIFENSGHIGEHEEHNEIDDTMDIDEGFFFEELDRHFGEA